MSPESVRAIFDYLPSGHLVWKVKTGAKVIVGRVAGSVRPDGYCIIRAMRERDYAHRLVWKWHHGEIPPGKVVDHINCDPTDNRVQNLRLISHAGNIMNRRGAQKNSRTGVRNVSYHHAAGKYVVSVRGVYFGSYESVDQAAVVAAKLRGAV